MSLANFSFRSEATLAIIDAIGIQIEDQHRTIQLFVNVSSEKTLPVSFRVERSIIIDKTRRTLIGKVIVRGLDTPGETHAVFDENGSGYIEVGTSATTSLLTTT